VRLGSVCAKSLPYLDQKLSRLDESSRRKKKGIHQRHVRQLE
jgi:hypothetical protein